MMTTTTQAYLPAFNQMKKDIVENEIPVPLTARERSALKVMKASKWPAAKTAKHSGDNDGDDDASGPGNETESSSTQNESDSKDLQVKEASAHGE